MFVIILCWLAYLYIFVTNLFEFINRFGFFQTIAAAVVIFFVLAIWTLRRLTRPKNAPARRSRPAAAPAPAADDSGTVTFRVAGVTFNNDDGTSRQDILRHIKFGDSPFVDDMDPDDLSVTIEETSWNGSLAFDVFANGYQIGMVPKTSVTAVQKAKNHVATCQVKSAKIIGGGKDSEGKPISYGCEITIDY